MKIPIISVVTPSYNQGQYLEATIQSVLSQKGDFYLDYIIMDGGSQDNSLIIIQKYEKLLKTSCQTTNHHQLIWYSSPSCKWCACKGVAYRWVSHKDNGQVAAIKQGFARSKGNYLHWLNSDDVFVTRHSLATILNYFTLDPKLTLVTGDGPFIRPNGKPFALHHVKRINFMELLYLDYHILQPASVITRSIYRPKYLNENYTCAFDGEFFIKIISLGHKYLKIPDQIAAFRLYPETKTLSLATLRYRENMSIGWTYCPNPWFYCISAVYRFFEIIIRPKVHHHWFEIFFIRLQNLAYQLIIHEKYAERI